MIWSIVSKSEMEGYKIPHVFQYYSEVIGKENVSLAVVDDNDPLAFVHEDDIVLLRTANRNIIENIKKRGAMTTAEDFETYDLVQDKRTFNDFLRTTCLIQTPRNFQLTEVVDGRSYFVKPRFGSESFGITSKCICLKKTEIVEQIERIERETNQASIIEEYIDGVDCTVACYYAPEKNDVMVHPILVENEEIGGIQTHKGKFDYNEYCSALTGKVGERACEISKEVFRLVGIKHHARIDYRITNDGQLYLIDVNLLPGLGPSAHFSKCLLLTENISYRDTIKAILNSAT